MKITYLDYTETMQDLIEEKERLLLIGEELQYKSKPSYRDLIRMRVVCKEIVLIEEEMEEVEREFKRGLGYKK